MTSWWQSHDVTWHSHILKCIMTLHHICTSSGALLLASLIPRLSMTCSTDKKLGRDLKCKWQSLTRAWKCGCFIIYGGLKMRVFYNIRSCIFLASRQYMRDNERLAMFKKVWNGYHQTSQWICSWQKWSLPCRLWGTAFQCWKLLRKVQSCREPWPLGIIATINFVSQTQCGLLSVLPCVILKVICAGLACGRYRAVGSCRFITATSLPS